MEAGNILVRNHHDAVLAQHRPHQRASLLQQTGADDDVVAAGAELDAQPRGLAHDATASTPRCAASAAMTRSSVVSGGPSSVSTVMSASA